ncbi:MAG: IS4 family transposase [Pirellulaceae bacterium]|nr:IS4 family transposase [Pirellulaceae bacterium]
MILELDVDRWAKEQFESCELGDARRNARAVTMAAQFAANPSGSTPEQTETWGDCKAAYRLFNSRDVTFAGLATPHWKQTCARTSGHYLLLGDTTMVSFDGDRQISGMGIVSSGSAQGYLLHSSLMVDAENQAVIGLAGQAIHYRQPVPKKEKPRARLQRPRESRLWGQVIDQVGPPPENVRFTHVFDRGGDNFEVYCHLLLQRTDWVVRAAQLKRLVTDSAGKTLQLREILKTLPVLGTYELSVRANQDQAARSATVEVRASTITLPLPRDCGKFARECGIVSMVMNMVEVLEANPAPGAKPLHWVLLTSHSVTSFEDAWRVIEYYEQRPRIEEFHKALKTGCRLEERLYETARRWEALTAMLSIVAVRLLQMKTIAKTEPDLPAEKLVPKTWIQMLSAMRKGKHKIIRTARDFLRGLAGLGGHLGRKHDGEPGWMTLWQGFNKLHLLLRGAAALHPKCG